LRLHVISQYLPPDGGGGSRRAANAVAGLRNKTSQIELITAFPHYPYGNVPRKYYRRIPALEKQQGVRVSPVWIHSIPQVSRGGLCRTLPFPSPRPSYHFIAVRVVMESRRHKSTQRYSTPEGLSRKTFGFVHSITSQGALSTRAEHERYTARQQLVVRSERHADEIPAKGFFRKRS